MSTRSGKRIHSSIEEPVVENMVQLKNERNTRSKQQKTGNVLPLTEKKRKHYVRYPSEEEVTTADHGNIEITVKNTRKSRRHTLKEQNKIASDCEPIIDVKAERSTRRTKKNSEKNELDSVELTLIKEVTEEKKKGKKKKAAKVSNTDENIENVPEVDIKINTKKKTNKKKNKKKSNSLIVTDVTENVNKKLNKSNASIDSFHSAAGSPVINTVHNSSNNKNCVLNESPKNRKAKRNVHDQESSMNVSVDTPNKRRKLTVETTSHQTNGSVKNSPTEELLSESDRSRCSVVNEVEGIDNNTFDKDNSVSALHKSLETSSKKKSNKKASCDKVDKNSTFEIDNSNKELSSTNKPKLSDKRPSLNNTFDGSFKRDATRTSIITGNGLNLNATFNRDNCNQLDASKINDGVNDVTHSGSKKKRKSSIKNSTYDKINEPPLTLNATFDKDILKNSSITNSVNRESKSSIDSFDDNKTQSLNSTYDKNSKAKNSISCLNATFDKPASLDSTFDKSLKKDSIDQSKMRPTAKSSLLSSDATDNSLNVTDDNSHVSINSDDSKLENIVNTTPVLVESSMDESKEESTDNPMDTEVINNTPRRESTSSEENKISPSHKADMRSEIKSITPSKKNGVVSMSPKQTSLVESHTSTPKKKVLPETKLATTPLKREGTFTKDSPDVKSNKLSKEMTPRRMSLPSPGCTPHPGSKNSLKKSVLNVTRSIEKSRRSSIADVAPRLTRVMFCSPVNNPAVVTQMKGKIIKSNLKGSNKSFVFDESVSELSRPARKRSYTQTEAEAERPSPARSVERSARTRTASAAGRLQEAKGERRTKLPNFAALHQKQFERMESLDDWQRRRGQRARLLATPPARAAPATPAEKEKNVSQSDTSTKKVETPKLKQPTAVPGFTKFGFKLNLDVNPFSIPSKSTEVKPKDKKPLKRQATLPSLAGATALRRDLAKQTIMREKTFAEKKHVHRDETRTVIKGVRTNRRFELQMKMRNINN
ncbi:protein ZDS2 [Vanessa cardui]|uniref:protein ZDS2 n=1 Tax=Vanessa cardui TaxID=171605 RepID=UPI001F1323B8|nr:protein ZDS2 [Vanessa cardui]